LIRASMLQLLRGNMRIFTAGTAQDHAVVYLRVFSSLVSHTRHNAAGVREGVAVNPRGSYDRDDGSSDAKRRRGFSANYCKADGQQRRIGFVRWLRSQRKM